MSHGEGAIRLFSWDTIYRIGVLQMRVPEPTFQGASFDLLDAGVKVAYEPDVTNVILHGSTYYIQYLNAQKTNDEINVNPNTNSTPQVATKREATTPA